MSKELVFSIGKIFDATSLEGALTQNKASEYYIAPYQRGYKWASASDNDAVCVLMKDLFDAYDTYRHQNLENEYYLQFITTKVSEIKESHVLEIIDGQQRLTTLTILLSILAYKEGNNQKAISNNLLLYGVRQSVNDFFKDHIYQNIETLLSKDWDNFRLEYPKYDEQDIYYLHCATRKINEKIEDNDIFATEGIENFKTYLLENVKIILNNIDDQDNINCEEIFSNLNDNKVDLTESDLIKGLLLTNSAREKINTSYKEITDLRAVIGRQWDEIALWANKEEIKAFFDSRLSKKVLLDELLCWLASNNGYKIMNNDKNSIFNYFQSQIKNKNKTADDYFCQLKEMKSILNEWFSNEEVHNLMGFVFFAKNSKISDIEFLGLLTKDKKDLRKILKEKCSEILDFDIETETSFDDNKKNAHDLLFALNVFRGKIRFNFTEFKEFKWTLEHIFPQSPEKLQEKLNSQEKLKENDIKLLKSLCLDNLGDYEKVKRQLNKHEEKMNPKDIYSSLVEKLEKDTCELTPDEITILFSLIGNKEILHSIGNMALLTDSDNSSNGNGLFDKKRCNIVNRISKGSFVPKHTYDVFSKLISENMTPDLTNWTINDIKEHKKWIKKEINNIKKVEVI